MSIIKSFSSLGRTTALGAAVLAAVSLSMAPGSAYAQRRGDHDGDRGRHGGHWRLTTGMAAVVGMVAMRWNGGHWRGGYYGGGWNNGEGVALGLLGGALAGAAIAGAANQYSYPSYAYPYSYSYPYSYGYAYPNYYGYGY